MSDGPSPESTRGVDRSPEAIADMARHLREGGRLTLYNIAPRAAALLAQVAKERDEARAAGAIEGALFEREKWEKFAQIEREYQAMFKEFEARATGAEQMQKLLAETAAAAERQLAEAREQIDRYREMYKDGVAVAEGHYARAETAERQLAEARAALAQLIESIERHMPRLALYERVHGELDDGKAWADIDPGFRLGDGPSYDGWLAYMQQSLINGLRDIVLTYQHRYVKTQDDALLSGETT